MTRPSKALFGLASIGAVLTSACGAERSTEPRPVAVLSTSPGGLFSFHVDFWINLHETLEHESLLPNPGFDGPKSLAHQSVAPASALAADDLARWQSALAFYGAHFTTHNTFDPAVMDETRFLAASASGATLPPCGAAAQWCAVITATAPVYRERFWPSHERLDRDYVERLSPQIAAHGEWMARRLAAVYETPWPSGPVDVEVTAAVPPFGASTIGEPPFTGAHAPLVAVSSEDPGYTGDTGLEMIFHEASHLLVGRVQAALDESAKRQGRTPPDNLWHLLLFYTAGHLMKERLGADYVPYAERPEHSIFTGRFAPCLSVLERAWQPYLDGHRALGPAVDAVVAAF
jgi:hypothetical protein